MRRMLEAIISSKSVIPNSCEWVEEVTFDASQGDIKLTQFRYRCAEFAINLIG